MDEDPNRGGALHYHSAKRSGPTESEPTEHLSGLRQDWVVDFFVKLTTSDGRARNCVTMSGVCVSPCLLLLVLWCVGAHRVDSELTKFDEDMERDMLAIDMLNRSGVLNSLLRSERHTVLRSVRAPRPLSQVPKRAQQGSRFALSLDVPTSILSVLIDLAKNQDMRTKAAANAELMARIGRRK